VIAMLSKRR